MRFPLKSALTAAGIFAAAAHPAAAFVAPPAFVDSDVRAPVLVQYIYREAPLLPWFDQRPLPPLPPLPDHDDGWDGYYDDDYTDAPPSRARLRHRRYPDHYEDDVLTPEEYHRRYGRGPLYQAGPAPDRNVERAFEEPPADTVVRGPHRQPKKNPKRLARAGGDTADAPNAGDVTVRRSIDPQAETTDKKPVVEDGSPAGTKPDETAKPTESEKPADGAKPAESAEPADEVKPADEAKLNPRAGSADEAKPGDEAKPAVEREAKTGIRVIVPPRSTDRPSVIIPGKPAPQSESPVASGD